MAHADGAETKAEVIVIAAPAGAHGCFSGAVEKSGSERWRFALNSVARHPFENAAIGKVLHGQLEDGGKILRQPVVVLRIESVRSHDGYLKLVSLFKGRSVARRKLGKPSGPASDLENFKNIAEGNILILR